MSKTAVEQKQYEGPAGVTCTPEEWLLIWQALTLIPTAENAPVRARIKSFLERREAGAAI